MINVNSAAEFDGLFRPASDERRQLVVVIVQIGFPVCGSYRFVVFFLELLIINRTHRRRHVLDLDLCLLIMTLMLVIPRVMAPLILGLAVVGLALFFRLIAFAIAHSVIGRHLALRTRLARKALAVGAHHPKIVLGVLKEVLGGNAIVARLGLPRQRQIALVHLIGVAADLYVGPIAVESLRPVWRTRAATAAAETKHA